MKSQQYIVTSENSPLTIPLNYRGGVVGVGAGPAGGGNYTAEFSMTPLDEGLTIITHAIANMAAATTIQQANIGPATALIVTLNSGSLVAVDLAQSDV